MSSIDPNKVDPTVYSLITSAQATNTAWDQKTADDKATMQSQLAQFLNYKDPFVSVLYAILVLLNTETTQAGDLVANTSEGKGGLQSAFSYSINYLTSQLSKGGNLSSADAQTCANTMSWVYEQLGMNDDGTAGTPPSWLSSSDQAKYAGWLNDAASAYCNEVAAIPGATVSGITNPKNKQNWTPSDLTRTWMIVTGPTAKQIWPVLTAQQQWDAQTKYDPTTNPNPSTSPNFQSITFAYGQLNTGMSGWASSNNQIENMWSDTEDRLIDLVNKMGSGETDQNKAFVTGAAPK